MPTYEYACQDCNNHIEVVQKMSDAPLVQCPECKKNSLKRILSAPAFHLKGSGWYKTDYASASTSGPTKEGDNTSSESSKKDSKEKSTVTTEASKPTTNSATSASSE